MTVHYPDDPSPKWNQPVLALGNFDGLHRGHMKIIDRVRRRAGERAGTPAAMTFDPHPPRVLRPDKAPPLLMTKAQKLEALGRAGMQGVAVLRFTRELSLWDPETFVRSVLVEWLRVSEVWVGANFLFGHNREGTFTVLRSLGARYGFRAEKIDPVRYKDFVVSSTRIRRLVSEGRVDEAGALLGHHYFIDGTVTRGAVRHDRQHRRRRSSVDHEHRTAADVRRRDDGNDRGARLRHRSGPVRRDHPPVVRPAAARRARVSGRRRAARAGGGRLPQRAAPVRPHLAVAGCRRTHPGALGILPSPSFLRAQWQSL
jgi:FAD synthase